MKNFNDSELMEIHYNLLSWLATSQYNMINEPERAKSQYYIGKLQGIESACIFAGVPDRLIYDILYKNNFKGLRNYNKLEIKIIFE